MTGSFHGNLSESSWPLNSPETSIVGSETAGGASVIKVPVKCIWKEEYAKFVSSHFGKNNGNVVVVVVVLKGSKIVIVE